MLKSRSNTRLAFSGASLILACLLFFISVWLLVVANHNDECGYTGQQGFYNDLPGRRRYDYGGGGRSREWFCTDTVPKWNSAGGVSLTTAIFQLIGSGLYFYTSSSARAFNNPKLRTGWWCASHILYIIGTLISIIIVKSADIFTAYAARPNLGYAYVGILVVNMIGCLVLPLLTFCLILRMMSDDRLESEAKFNDTGSTYSFRD